MLPADWWGQLIAGRSREVGLVLTSLLGLAWLGRALGLRLYSDNSELATAYFN